MSDGDYSGDETQNAGLSRVWLGFGLGSLILLVAMTSLVALNLGDPDVGDAAAPTVDEGVNRSATAYISPDELVSPTVQVVGLSEDDEVLCAGSGTVVRPNGQVLTSAQVVTRSEDCRFTKLGIAVSVDTDVAPVLAYEAELLVADAVLDLAVVQAVRNVADGSTLSGQFAAPTLGNSDEVEEGEDITLQGFSTEDDVSLRIVETMITGFAPRSGIPDALMLQTDSEAVSGFAGATASDSSGSIVGVVASSSSDELRCLDLPQAVGAEESVTEDCEELGESMIVIRPINLALEIVDGVQGASPIEAESSETSNDLSELSFSNPRFSLGRTSDQPGEIVRTAQAGVDELCLFVDWTGMPEGTTWDVIWYLDGSPRLDYSLRGEVWNEGTTGDDFWACASDQSGLAAGTYEVGFFVEEVNIFAEGFVVTEEAVDVHEVTWTNDIDGAEICSLAINPLGSGPVGLNELPSGDIIEPGDSVTLEVAAGTIVVAADDCEGTRLAIQLDGLDVDGPKDYSIGI